MTFLCFVCFYVIYCDTDRELLEVNVMMMKKKMMMMMMMTTIRLGFDLT